jgi:hypothetical protein
MSSQNSIFITCKTVERKVSIFNMIDRSIIPSLCCPFCVFHFIKKKEREEGASRVGRYKAQLTEQPTGWQLARA